MNAPTKAEAERWRQVRRAVERRTTALARPGGRFVLVDDNALGYSGGRARTALPFLEHHGEYAGPPGDDATAISELERMRGAGARFVIFAEPAFWWLDYYSGLHRHLNDSYPCVEQTDELVIFDLRPQPLRQAVAAGTDILVKPARRGARRIEEGARARLGFLPSDPLRRTLEIFLSRHDLVVEAGPFAGLTYPPETVDGDHVHLTTKLLGVYELELHPFIESLTGSRVDRVVNVGAGEGYYCVGFARRFEDATVWGFEMDAARRALCRRLAQLNEVGNRVQLEECCDLARLQELSGPSTLIVVDCEGCEFDLLRPDAAPALAEATLIVELHEENRRGDELVGRFEATHRVELVEARAREIRNYPQIGFMPFVERHLALQELRMYQMRWAVMTPRGQPRP